MLVNKARKAIESTYTDSCNVYENTQTKTNGVTSFTMEKIYSDLPCRISFESIPSTSPSDTASKVSQTIKLFIAPEVQITPGARIDVTRLNRTESYESCGVCAKYGTHQEIQLQIVEENA